MAVNIPESAILQPANTASKDNTGANGYSMSWKGPYDDLSAAAAAIEQGDLYQGMTVATLSLTTIPGGWGLLQISFSATSASESGGGIAPISDKWTIKSCRNDVSVMAYCGKDDNNPNRCWIECWQREPDAQVAKVGNYTKPDGTIADLTKEPHVSATLKLMDKIEQGVESVIRFYPIVSRKRVYSSVPPECLQDLGYIDTPPAPGVGSKSPSGLAAVISEYQWLKVQDDADQLDGNKWMRTESWMGIERVDDEDSPWDPDLYGPNRWGMPFYNGGEQQGGGNS